MNLTQGTNIPGKANKPFDIFGFLARYGVLLTVLGAFTLTMLVPFILMLRKPNFEVSALLKIDPVIPSLITKTEDPSITGFYHDFVRTQARRIKEHDILKQAISRLTPEQHAALFASNLPVDTSIRLLQTWLQASPVPRTHLIELSIQSPRKEGLAPILNRVMEAYLQSMLAEQEQKDERRLAYLEDKISLLQKSIGNKEQQLENLAKAALSSSFSETSNVWQSRLVTLQNHYINTSNARIVSENAYRFGKEAKKELEALSLTPLVEAGLLENQGIAFTTSWTYQQLQEMRKSIDGVTAVNEDRKRVEKRMEAMREYEKSLRSETRANINEVVTGKRELELSQELIQKRKSFDEAMANERQILAELDRTMEKSAENSARLLKGQGLAIELEHDRNLLFRLDTRIHELKIESRAPLRVMIESMARPPKKPAGSNIKKLVMACVILSFGVVASVFILIELRDNRIHSPKNVLQALGSPPSWPISRAPRGVPFERVLSLAPESVTAKAVRSLATKLYREQQESQAKVFLFTSVEAGNGSSGIAENVASSLLGQSERILLIDANLQEWDIADLISEAAEPFSSQSVFNAIQYDPERGYDVLIPFIPKTSNRTISRLLGKLLTEAREKYDFICIDTAPVLKSDLSEYLAVRSDVVVLICQGDSTNYRDLRRAAEIIIRLEVPALAPVLNWGGKKRKPKYEAYIDRVSTTINRWLGNKTSSSHRSRGSVHE